MKTQVTNNLTGKIAFEEAVELQDIPFKINYEEQRRQAYNAESDELFRIYLIYKDLEKPLEEIELARKTWLEKREQIKLSYSNL